MLTSSLAPIPASDRIWGLVSGFPGKRRTERQLLMLQAFIDESGRGQGDMFILAGYIAPARIWAEEFSPKWQALLDIGSPKFGKLQTFKMRKMARDLESAERFYRAIEDSVTAEVSCTINIAGLHKAYREFPWPVPLIQTQGITNPYYFAFHAIIDMLAQHQHMLKIEEPVDFIFDNTTEKRNCLDAWEDIKKYSRPDVRALMGDTPSFKDDSLTLPLQAADLLAYWVREWENQGVQGNLEQMHFPWSREKTIPGISFMLEEKDFIVEFNKIFNPEVAERIAKPGGKFPNQSILDLYKPKVANTRIRLGDLGQMEPKAIPISNSSSVRSEYSNSVNVGFGPWDVRLTFTEIAQDSQGAVVQELKANLIMSPAHARALVGVLSTALAQYENQFGKIIQPNPPPSENEESGKMPA